MASYSDYINRGDAVLAVYERIKQIGMDFNADVLSIRQSIREVPAADVAEVRHGKWIHSTDADDGYCSVCNCDMPMFMEDWEWRYCETPYCPNCGAKMESEPSE